MGIDISFAVEQRRGDGWHSVRSKFGPVWFDDRNSELFSLLTGRDFGLCTLRPLTSVAPLRDWPADLSDGARQELYAWCDPDGWGRCDEDENDGFGRSWLDVGDLTSFDWISWWTGRSSRPMDFS